MTRDQENHGRREGYPPRGEASRRGYRDARPKLWLVCPKCNGLAGFVFPEFVKRSGEPRRGDPATGGAEHEEGGR